MKNKEKIPSSFSLMNWLKPIGVTCSKFINLFENTISIGGAQKACSLMDRASVSLTGRCGFEAFAKIPAQVLPSKSIQKMLKSKLSPRLHLPLKPKIKFILYSSKKNNQARSLMDRTSSLIVDRIVNTNLYLNVSNDSLSFGGLK